MPRRSVPSSTATAKKQKVMDEQKNDEQEDVVQLSRAKDNITPAANELHNVNQQEKEQVTFPWDPKDCVPVNVATKAAATSAFEHWIGSHVKGMKFEDWSPPSYPETNKEYPQVSESFIKLVKLYHQNAEKEIAQKAN